MNRRNFNSTPRIAIAVSLTAICTFAFFWTRSWASSGIAESAREQEKIVAANRVEVADEPEYSLKIASAPINGTGTLKRHGALEIPADDGYEGKGSPRVVLAADFDSDGIKDLLVAHNNRLVLHRGNINAFAPQTQAAWEAIRDGRFVSPFERKTRAFDVPVGADFILSPAILTATPDSTRLLPLGATTLCTFWKATGRADFLTSVG